MGRSYGLNRSSPKNNYPDFVTKFNGIYLDFVTSGRDYLDFITRNDKFYPDFVTKFDGIYLDFVTNRKNYPDFITRK